MPASTLCRPDAANTCAAQGRSSRDDCNEVIPNLCSLLVMQWSGMCGSHAMGRLWFRRMSRRDDPQTIGVKMNAYASRDSRGLSAPNAKRLSQPIKQVPQTERNVFLLMSVRPAN